MTKSATRVGEDIFELQNEAGEKSFLVYHSHHNIGVFHDRAEAESALAEHAREEAEFHREHEARQKEMRDTPTAYERRHPLETRVLLLSRIVAEIARGILHGDDVSSRDLWELYGELCREREDAGETVDGQEIRE